MNSPVKFGIGKGPEAPAPPPPVEGKPAPEVPLGAEPSQPREAERVPEEIPEMVIEAPPQEGEEPAKPAKLVSTPPPPSAIREGDITAGDIDAAGADDLTRRLIETNQTLS